MATLRCRRTEQGIWTGTTAAPLPADIYRSNFNVDGLSIVDPVNTRFSPAFGRVARSAFQVPGDNAWTPIPGTVRGAVAHHVFHSKVTDDDREFYVYTPPNYDPKRRQPYPVIVLQHGLGDDAKAWTHYGGANTTLDNLINQGKAAPVIMVNTLGYGTANGGLGIDAPEMQGNFMRILNEEVMTSPSTGSTTRPPTRQITRSPACRWAAGKRSWRFEQSGQIRLVRLFQRRLRQLGADDPVAQPPASPAVVAAAAAARRTPRAQEAARAGCRGCDGSGRPDAAPGSGSGRGGFGGAGIGTGRVFDERLPLLFPTWTPREQTRIKLLWISIRTADDLPRHEPTVQVLPAVQGSRAHLHRVPQRGPRMAAVAKELRRVRSGDLQIGLLTRLVITRPSHGSVSPNECPLGPGMRHSSHCLGRKVI